jgi:hypothetical protein
MTKLLLSWISVFSLVFTFSFVQSQPIYDDFDDYELGALTVQPGADHWLTWNNSPGGNMETFVVDEEYFSPPHSMRVAEGGVEDVVFLLGSDLGSGQYIIEWNMLLPAGKTGYYNHQQSQTVAIGWNFDVMFNMNSATPGIATILSGVTPVANFTYPEGEWFNVRHHLDLDGGVMELFIDDESVYVTATYFNTIGSINFYSIDANNRYYIDDMVFEVYEEEEPTNVSEEQLQAVQIFPNPATTTLNINLSGVSGSAVTWTLFDLLGKQLGTDTFTEQQLATIDVSHLPTGLYLLTLGNDAAERTFRFVVE